MEQSSRAGLHVAIIMDGNGRWAVGRGRPRIMGHRAGVKVVRRVVEAAPDIGISVLTLHAFSSDNWQRPGREVSALMRLFHSYLASETARLVQNGVRLCVVGRRDRLAPQLVRAVDAAEAATRGGKALLLRLAIDYSARDLILAATATATAMAGGPGGAVLDRESFARALHRAGHSPPVPDVDLLIRSGGEQRLSDFLLWECAYAELYFEPCMWPDFGEAELRAAVRAFHARERRFGALPEAAAAS